jgi:RHS repeat-associated protein
MNRIIRLFCVATLSVSSFAMAQNLGTGLYPFGSFDSRGPDTINLGNLNSHIDIPIFHKAGRGIPFAYDLTYDSLVWKPVGLSGSQAWQPVQNFGWIAQTVVMTGYVSYATHNYVCDWPLPKHGNFYIYDTWVYHDAFGTSHSFSGQLEYDPTGCDTTTTSFTSQSSDGSGLTLIASGSATPHTTQSITTSKGQSMVVPTAPASVGSSITDSNGNQVSVSSTGVYTDTLGAPALTVTGSGTPASPVTLKYPVTPQAGGSTSATASIAYKAYTAQTNFQCPGVTEYGSTSVNLIDHISLADGSTYSFTYEATPGVSGAVTGRLASVTLPTGGTITYSYTGGCSAAGAGINPDGTVGSLARATSDGTRTYSRSAIPGYETGNASDTTLQDEKGNQSVYQFTINSGFFYETQRTIYQGTISGSVLLNQYTCYNGVQPPCNGPAITMPISKTIALTSYNNGTQLGTTNLYDASGMLTSSTLTSGGSILEKTTNVYNLLEEVTTSTTTDPSGNNVASSTYGYDETAPTATSGIPQHTAVSGTRGNQTSAHVSTGSGSLTTTTTYYDTGVPIAITTPNGTTQYGYDSTQTFTTTTTLPTPSSGVALATSAIYDQPSGALISATGMNSGQTTQVTQYDRLLRPTAVSLPNGSQVTAIYYNPMQTNTNQTMANGASATTATLLDAYGRTSRVAVYNGQSANGWYQVDYCYDGTGLLQFQSVKYQSTGFVAPKQCSGNGTTYAYDALGRVTSSTNADGTSSTLYTGRAVETTDVNGVKKITQYDLLGRIAGVCEISSNTLIGSGSPGPCVYGLPGSTSPMDISGNGFGTVYNYNLASHTTTITQGAQTRTVLTDPAGRTTSVTEPERGLTSYNYVYNSSTGLLVTRTRPKANQNSANVLTTTNTQYDSLGRVVSVTYNDGLTPNKTFSYDAAVYWSNGSSATNLKGQLAVMGAFTSAADHTGALFSYDLMGNVTTMWQCAPSTCPTASGQLSRPALTFSYDGVGNLTGEFDGASGLITYGRSPAGEVTSITNQSYNNAPYNPPNLVSNVVNGPNGPISYTLGNGLNFYKEYDSSGRPYGQWVCTGAAQVNCGTQIYGTGAYMSGTRVAAMDDTVIGGHISLGYDEFNRLTSTNRTYYNNSQNNFTYGYDRWGNRWSQTVTSGSGPQPSLAFNTANNQITSTGYVYDAAGNLTSDGFHTYTYDAEGNILSVDGGSSGQYVYDALNRRVRTQTAGSTNEYLFDYAGRRTSTWQVSNNFGDEGRIYWDGKQIAFRSIDGTTYFDHQDTLGTERMRTNYAGHIAGMYTSLPFGDGPSESSVVGSADQDSLHFAQLDHDTESTTDHAQFRQYSPTQGRWMSPDPYDGSYDTSNPQSMNRYGYVLNNPLSWADPSGLNPCDGVSGDSGDARPANGGVTAHVCLSPYQPPSLATVLCIFFGCGGPASANGSSSHPTGGGGGAPTAAAPKNGNSKTPPCSSINLATNSLSSLAAFSNRGLFVGGSFGLTAPTVATGITLGFYADPSGTVSRVDTRSGSIGLATGGSASGGFTFGVSNFKNGGFSGWSGETTTTAGAGLSASSTYSYNSNGYGVTLTLGPGAGLSASTGASNTTLTPVCHKGVSVLDF